MNKKYFQFLFLFFIILIFIDFFIHSDIVSYAIYQSSYIWFYQLIPSIFPMYTIIDIFTNYNLFYKINKIISPITNYLFKLKNNASKIFILSIISGFPSNSKYIKESLDNKNIDIQEANKLLLFTHFSNPLFLIQSIGVNFLKNKKIGILILIVHYLTNFIIGYANRNYYISNDSKTNLNYNKKSSLITTLTNSIYNTMKILVLLYGILTFFMIITSLIQTNIHLPNLLNAILSGILEITQGIYQISNLNIPIIYKSSIITFLISFGGICIHMQVFGILNEYHLSYIDYFKARITHAFLSASIIFLIIHIFIK